MRASLRALLALAVAAGGQALAPAPADAQVQVTVRRLAPVDAIYLADLLPGRAGARLDLLGITLVATDGGTAAASRAPARAGERTAASGALVLEVSVAREAPAPAEIFRGTTDPFVLPEGVRHLTVRDLTTEGGPFAVTDYAVNDGLLEEAGLRSGRLPAGTYVFTVVARAAEGAALDGDELRITLGATSRVDLLAPGAPADAGAPPLVPGPTPRFLWSADGEAAGARYRLRVVPVDGEGSPVEAVQAAFPVWEAVTTATSAFYPASAQAIRLEPGATYAWQVTREVATSGGDEIVESPIFWFRVAAGGVPGAAPDARFAGLLRALGLSPELDGFTPVGARREDGRTIPLPELEALLAAIAAGEIPVLSVRVQ